MRKQPANTRLNAKPTNQPTDVGTDTNDLNISTFALQDLIKPSFDLWLLAWFLGLVTVFSVLILLMLSGWFLSAAALAGMTALGAHTFNYLLPAAIIRTLAITRTAGRYGELMVSHHAIFHLLKVLRVKFFVALSAKPLTQQRTALQSGQHMHRLVSDIDTLNEFNLRFVSPWLMGTLTVLVVAGFLCWVLAGIGSLHWAVVTPLAGGLIGVLFVPMVLNRQGIAHAKRLAQNNENRRLALINPLSIITPLLLWGQWQKQTQPFINLDKNAQQQHWQAQKHRSIAMLIMQWGIMSVLLLTLLAIGLSMGHGHESINDMATPTALTTPSNLAHVNLTHVPFNIPLVVGLVLGLFGLNEVVLPLAQHYLAYGNATVAKQRLNDLLNQQQTTFLPTTPSPHTPLPNMPNAPLTAQLTNVTAKLPQALVGASNINATIRSGIPLIISGASGAGKSTLLACLAGELLPQTGNITLNGVNWYDYDWADQLGYLGQRLDIFDQSLANNLRLGNPNATDDELLTALDKVALSDWIASQPQGLETQLGEYGTLVSGGQARRIALARLLLKPRKVLLLDEPFAGLDAHTRQYVWEQLKAHQANGLLVIVSHHQDDWQMKGANNCHLKSNRIYA